MNRNLRGIFAMIPLALYGVSISPTAKAQAALQTTRTDIDYADWSAAGPDGSNPANPFTINSNLGNVLTVSEASGVFSRDTEGTASWHGNFAPNDALLDTGVFYGTGTGPITIHFATPVSEAGAQIQYDAFSGFTAQVQAFDAGNNLLGTFTEDGVSNDNNDNSAIFIGVRDATTPLSSIVFSISDTDGGNLPATDFAINRLDIGSEVIASTPEPGSVALFLGLGTSVGFAVRRRKRSR